MDDNSSHFVSFGLIFFLIDFMYLYAALIP